MKTFHPLQSEKIAAGTASQRIAVPSDRNGRVCRIVTSSATGLVFAKVGDSTVVVSETDSLAIVAGTETRFIHDGIGARFLAVIASEPMDVFVSFGSEVR